MSSFRMIKATPDPTNTMPPQEPMDLPYVAEAYESGIELPRTLATVAFSNIHYSAVGILNTQAKNPYDAIIGDDVSGRIPTLIMHRVLRHAHTAGQIEKVPKTYFVASGRDKADHTDTWDKNMKTHIKDTLGTTPVKRALVITDIVCFGNSMERIQNALSSAGIDSDYRTVGGNVLYLHDTEYGNNLASRAAVGVEKTPPRPTTHRHPDFNGTQVAQLRYFLDDYAGAIFAAVQRTNQIKREVEELQALA